jgi:uncharacterized membrane protein
MIGEALSVLMRWLHIASVAGLVGGMIYGRAVMATAAGELAPEPRKALDERAAALFRRIVVVAIVCLTLSGVYTIVTHPGHSTFHNILLGVKLLLVAHIFASAILLTQPGNERRGRQMMSAAISGLIVIAISAYLRFNY